MQRQNMVTVRPARPEDSDAILMLIDALADYEKLARPDAEAKQRLLADAFAERPRFSILLAEKRAGDGGADSAEEQSDAGAGGIVGYAFLLETYSTFLALPTLYLEDLFVLPSARGTGAGSALFDAVKAEAKRRGCGRVEFVVLDWNQLARDFYHRKGGKHLQDWAFYRVDAADF